MGIDFSNWRTTIGGIIMAIGTIATQAPIPPQYSWIPTVVAAIGGAITGITAKDKNVHSTSEQVKEADMKAAGLLK